MNRLLSIIFTMVVMLCVVGGARAQKLVIGSNAPALKDIRWMAGTYDAKKSLVILFYQQNNISCQDQYEVLKQIVDEKPVLGVVLTRDSSVDAEVLSDGGKIAVGYDDSGEVFSAYGVKYLPYAIAINEEDKILWLGSLSGVKIN